MNRTCFDICILSLINNSSRCALSAGEGACVPAGL
jgi:hypothetical protein